MANSTGRPTKYFDCFTPENKKKILAGYKNGEADPAAIGILDINQDTFYEWLKDENKPSFSECIKKGRVLAQVWWEEEGKKGLGAGKMNAAIYCFIMKNRFKHDYGEVKEQQDRIIIIDKGNLTEDSNAK